jgi:hypothetical protein
MRQFLAAVVAVLAVAGCASAGSSTFAPFTPAVTVVPPASTTPPAPRPVTAPPASSHSASSQPAASPSASYPSDWKLPDRHLSPGAVQPGYTIADICPHVNPALEAMRPSSADKAKVYAAYGITSHPAGKYEVDHVVPVELLGLVGAAAGDPTLNLYPELNDTPDPVMVRKYHLSPVYVHNSKDILEDVLHQKACAGIVPLAEAQHAIATDWRQAYAQYVGKPPAS